MPEYPSAILKKKRDRLISAAIRENTPDFLNAHTLILDEYFCQCYESSLVGPLLMTEKNPYAMIALGGYGRREQCVHSDIDLLFLFEKQVPDAVESLIQEIVYPLWDIGISVGHATRSIAECLDIAATDIEVLTSLLDGRLICGMTPLFTSFMTLLRQDVIIPKSSELVSILIEASENRHRRYGDSAYLLEPNLKEGQGGLRDYHTIRWIAQIRSDIREFRDLEYYGYLSHDEFQQLNQALSFIWIIRNNLHHMANRKCDQLHFEYQPKLARRLEFIRSDVLHPVERMLSRIHAEMEFVKQQLRIFLYDLSHEKKSARQMKGGVKTKIPGIEIQRGAVNFVSGEAIFHNPFLLMQIFEQSARFNLPLSGEARRLIREFQHLADEDFIAASQTVRSFEKVLTASSPRFHALDEMLLAGFLPIFIPEYKKITNRIQYDEYHLYPVDTHSLRVVSTIKKFGTSEDSAECTLCGELYKDIFPMRKWLLWAGLLHDVGKGEQTGSHSHIGAVMARDILARYGYKKRDIDTVVFLIEEHLLLIKTATRRDINDEETSIGCARKIRDVAHLKMLYLLTVADSISTGPKAWNEWTSALLRDFFLKVLNILEHGDLASQQVIRDMEKKKSLILLSAGSASAVQEIKSLYEVMSPRYLVYASTSDIMKHIHLFQEKGDSAFAWKIEGSENTHTRIVTICARDRPGLFSKIAGVFTLNGMDILDAQIFTWRNNTALDIFNVTPPPDLLFEQERWDRAHENLMDALSGSLDLAVALRHRQEAGFPERHQQDQRPHRVEVDNAASSFFTIIEVFSQNSPGLLYHITDAIFRCGLDIWVAKIATKVDQIVDVFYVRDFDGQKIDSPDQVASVRHALMNVLRGNGKQEETDEKN
ncbi:MAG: [protein-PII] uridylyltransferase [Desulfatirhabdiaceae bacterium]